MYACPLCYLVHYLITTYSALYWGDLVQQRNPTCWVDTYQGGLACCHHQNLLLDKDQTPSEEILSYQMKFRWGEKGRWSKESVSTLLPAGSTTSPTPLHQRRSRPLTRTSWGCTTRPRPMPGSTTFPSAPRGSARSTVSTRSPHTSRCPTCWGWGPSSIITVSKAPLGLRCEDQPQLLGRHEAVHWDQPDLRRRPLPRPQLYQYGALPRWHRGPPLCSLPGLRRDSWGLWWARIPRPPPVSLGQGNRGADGAGLSSLRRQPDLHQEEQQHLHSLRRDGFVADERSPRQPVINDYKKHFNIIQYTTLFFE